MSTTVEMSSPGGSPRAAVTPPVPGRAAVGVVGLGYAGLPMAVCVAGSGRLTVGYDIDTGVVDDIAGGRSRVETVTRAELLRVEPALRCTTDAVELSGCSVVLICVPTPLAPDGTPDLALLVAACQDVSAQLQPGQLVIVESTVHPGCTEDVVLPVLEASGLLGGLDFSLAFASERVDPGNAAFSVRDTPKVVGGLTRACGARTADFYRSLGLPVYVTRGTREAEASKVLENSYRLVNIALVNEFAQYCHAAGIDVMDTITAAATKPFGFAPFSPSAGAGGHCIPVDPVYLAYAARRVEEPITLVERSLDVNHAMSAWVVDRVLTALERRPGDDARPPRAALLGVAYKAGVADLRNSAAEAVARGLRHRGVDVRFHDPLVAEWVVDGQPVDRIDRPETDESCDLLVVLHRRFCRLGSTAAVPVFDPFGASDRAVR